MVEESGIGKGESGGENKLTNLYWTVSLLATDYTETFCLTKSKFIFSNGLCLTHMYTQTGFTLPVYFLTWHWPSAVHYQNPPLSDENLPLQRSKLMGLSFRSTLLWTTQSLCGGPVFWIHTFHNRIIVFNNYYNSGNFYSAISNQKRVSTLRFTRSTKMQTLNHNVLLITQS